MKTWMKRKNNKRILGLALGFGLAFTQIAYGEIDVPPHPSEAANPVSTAPSGVSPDTAAPTATTPVGYPDTATPTAPVNAPDAAGVEEPTNQPSTADPANAANPVPDVPDTDGSSSALQEPQVAAQGAVVVDAAGRVLYGKNQDQQFYPASITKVMTALLVLERCNLNDVVTFSASATTNLESGAVTLDIVEGDQLTVEQCLYGLMIKSANEIGNGLAEHVAGSVSAFADLMNARAAQLGCKNTHFVNPHGLNNAEHKTTPYDMALIMQAALQNEVFRRIDSTVTYEFPATKNAGARTITMGHKMLNPSDSRYYEGIIGGKTGYTSLAGNTLVTGVERDGVRLVAVVMKAQGSHYTDTKAMLDYAFANYGRLTGKADSRQPEGSPASPEKQTPVGPGVSNPTGGQNPAGPGTPNPSGGQNPAGSGTPNHSGGQNPAGSGTPNPSGGQNPAGSGTPNPSGGQNPAGSDTPNPTGGQNPAGPGMPVPSDAPTPATGTAHPQGTAAGSWKRDGIGWYYVKADGSRAVNEWQSVDGLDYWFDSRGYMAEGWQELSAGHWYFFMPSVGCVLKGQWVQDGGIWYYLGNDGVMLTNTTTPDGYRVDGKGAWIK